MDCSTLPATGLEDNITDDMLDLYMEEALDSNMTSGLCNVTAQNTGVGRPCLISNANSTSFSLRHGNLAAFALGTRRPSEHVKVEGQSSSSLMGLESMENIVLQRQSRRTSVQQRPLLEDDASVAESGGAAGASISDLTSDDSGDFALLTQDVRDAATYDTIRDYLVYCKRQEHDLADLEEECARLEAEQQRLYGTAVAVNMAKRGSTAPPGLQADATVPGGKLDGLLLGSAPTAQTVAEQFGEEDIDPLTPCPYVDSYTSGKGQTRYRYAEPDVRGDYTPVFKSGFLYRCATPEGLWVFYNDSQKYRMLVKYLFGASSTLAAGPHATLRRLPSGEMEIAVTVWPQQTEVLLQGEVNGFKNLSVATPVDASYANPHTAASTAAARTLLSRYARQCGKSSVSMLTPADVLDCCLGGGKDGTVHGLAETAKSSSPTPFSAASPTTAPHYVDPAFPPGSAALYRHGIDDLFLWDMPWRRPVDYLPKAHATEACLFAGAALPTDPCTGDGGDAYLCSAASVLAEHPDGVYNLFRHPSSSASPAEEDDAGAEERAVGAYYVTLGHGGWWTSTIVDAYLPASLRGPDMGRCGHDLRKLWYPLLEKAYAKLHGSYAAIQCGDPLEALQDLTGFPTFRFDEEWAEVAEEARGTHTVEAEDLFGMLEEKVNTCGYAVCLSLPDEGPSEAKAVQMGMVYGMSYAVLRVVRHDDYRLVQVRCPTMRLDGDGLWCAESVRWRQEPALAKLCGVRPVVPASCSSANEDGEDGDEAAEADFTPGGLWLDWSEALTMFEGGGVCCTHRGWSEDCRVRGAFHDGVPSLVLEVRVEAAASGGNADPVEAYCVLSQEDDRGLPPDYPNRALQPLMLCVSSAADPEDPFELSASTLPSTRQSIRLACSTDPDSPTEQLSYILGRDTALRATFKPSVHPYYVIPRCLGEMSNKLFTVGIISATRVTKNGRLRVRAVQLPPSSPVFKNQRDFSTEQVTSVAAASFQLRGADGRVHVGCGSSIG